MRIILMPVPPMSMVSVRGAPFGLAFIAASLQPLRVNEGTVRVIHGLIGVRAKGIALRLRQVLRQPGAAQAVEVREAGCQPGDRDSVLLRERDHSAPRGLSGLDLAPDLFVEQQVAKGDVLQVARIAGIMGTKQTSALIPMCHPLEITNVEVDLWPDPEGPCVCIEARVRNVGRTGVEMEALTAVTVAGLTVYDMCKSLDRQMRLSGVELLYKSGGKSGEYVHPEYQPQ